MRTLVVVHVVAGIVETLRRLRQHPEETECQFLNRTIEKARAIVKKGTPEGFDPTTDSCEIFALDDRTGEGTSVWAMDQKNENA